MDNLKSFFGLKQDKKLTYSINEGSEFDRYLLGTKGASLCGMAKLGINVPPGFIISSECCIEFNKTPAFGGKSLATPLQDQITNAIHALEKKTKSEFGVIRHHHAPPTRDEKMKYTSIPLFLSVRSSTEVYMPGLTETVLDLGMNDEIVRVLAESSNNARWAYDSYRRFLSRFGCFVMGFDEDVFEEIMWKYRSTRGCRKGQVADDSVLSEEDIRSIVEEFKTLVHPPDNVWTQLTMAIEAMFLSWSSPAARRHRDAHNIQQDVGCAVIVQQMVHCNLNSISGSGVISTRNGITGSKDMTGEFVGRDVYTHRAAPIDLKQFKQTFPLLFEELAYAGTLLEKHWRDVQDVEFTVENGGLFILETRGGKRSELAAVRIAVNMVEERIINEREALLRIDPRAMDFFLRRMIDTSHDGHGQIHDIIGLGNAASGGVCTGELVFSVEEVKKCNKPCVLVLDSLKIKLPDLNLVAGVVTLSGVGGFSSQVASHMREHGKPAISCLRLPDGTQAELAQLEGEGGGGHIGDYWKGRDSQLEGEEHQWEERQTEVQGSPHTQAYLQREGKTQAVVRGRGEGGGSRPHKTAKMGDKADKGDKGDKATSSPTIPSPPPLPSPVFELITAFDAPNLRKGNVVTLDGSNGVLYKGVIPTINCCEDKYYRTVMKWAQRYNRMSIYSNCLSLDDVLISRVLGAEGVGELHIESLIRSQPERVSLMRVLLLSKDVKERAVCIQALTAMLHQDFLQVFKTIRSGRSVTLCLIECPLHTFLPHRSLSDSFSYEFEQEMLSLANKIGGVKEASASGDHGISMQECEARIIEEKERDIRGCSVSVLRPDLLMLQTRAIIGAAHELLVTEDIRVSPRILLGSVCSEHEVSSVMPHLHFAAQSVYLDHYNIKDTVKIDQDRKRAEVVRANGVGGVGGEETKEPETHTSEIQGRVGREEGQAMEGRDTLYTKANGKVHYKVGVKISCPRACIKASKILAEDGVEFALLDTEELTKHVFGVEYGGSHCLMSEYREKHIVRQNPFLSIDLSGVGEMVRKTMQRCRQVNPTAEIGVSSRHSGDPTSIRFFNKIKVDYLSVRLAQVPAAKLAAAQAHIEDRQTHQTVYAPSPPFTPLHFYRDGTLLHGNVSSPPHPWYGQL